MPRIRASTAFAAVTDVNALVRTSRNAVFARLCSLTVLVVSCRRAPSTVTNAPALDASPNVSLRVAEPLADAAPRCCPWRWRDDTTLAIAAPPEELPLGIRSLCAADRVAVVWRWGVALHMATRTMHQQAAWVERRDITNDVATLGEPYAHAGDVWIPWITAGAHATLRVARITDVVMHSEPHASRWGAYHDAVVLYARGERALVLTTVEARGGSRVLAHRLSVIPSAQATAHFAEGVIGVARGGAEAVVLTTSRVADAGPSSMLRAHRVDSALAMTFAAPVNTALLATMPAGAVRVGDGVAVGPGHFEFAPGPTERGVVLFETVVGAERGAVRVAWLGTDAPASTQMLPMVATGLAAVRDVATEPGAAEIEYWDDRRVPQRARVTATGMHGTVATGGALSTESAVRAAARSYDEFMCGGVLWRVSTRRDGDQVHVDARHAACDE
jgi:hypothetical protein